MGLHLLSFVGFVISGVFAVWLVWGIARSGRGCRATRSVPHAAAGPCARSSSSTGSCGSARTMRPLAALGVDRRPERVQHGLLGRLDDRGEERVQVRVGNGERSTAVGGASSRSLAAVEKARKISPLP